MAIYISVFSTVSSLSFCDSDSKYSLSQELHTAMGVRSQMLADIEYQILEL